jgi:hypothetical protein
MELILNSRIAKLHYLQKSPNLVREPQQFPLSKVQVFKAEKFRLSLLYTAILAAVRTLGTQSPWDRDKYVATRSSGDWCHNMPERLGGHLLHLYSVEMLQSQWSLGVSSWMMGKSDAAHVYNTPY